MADQNPGRERQRLAELYASMADGELENLASEAATLSDVAQEALNRELSKRKLPIERQVTPPAKPPNEEHPKLVTIRKFLSVPEAQMAKSLLESAGIECFLADENTVRMDWFWSNAIGGVKLWVKEEDAATATAILDEGRPESFEVEDVGEYTQPKCPKCGSDDVSFGGLNRRVAYGSLLAGVPAPLRHVGWKCRACGHEWRDQNEGA